MRIERLLIDREVLDGDRLLDAQGPSYGFVGHSSGELVGRSMCIMLHRT